MTQELEDLIFSYAIVLMPAFQVILEAISYAMGIPLGITPLFYLFLAYTYYLVLRRKAYLNAFFIILNCLAVLNLIFASDKYITFIELALFMTFANTSLLIFTKSVKIIELKNKLAMAVFLLVLAGFYTFLIGIDPLSSENFYEGKYHAGIFGLPHPAAYLLLIIILYDLIYNRRMGVLSMLSLLGILLSGVRTALIAAVIFISIMIILKQLAFKGKQSWKYAVVPILLFLILASYFFSDSTVTQSIKERIFGEEDDANVDEYSNGRISLAVIILVDVFESRNFPEVLFGKPADRVYDLTEGKLGARLWAHNDFTMVLSMFGLFGLIGYLYFLAYLPLRYMREFTHDRTIFLLVLGFIAVIAALALLNGFYHYRSNPFYLYLLASIPLVMMPNQSAPSSVQSSHKGYVASKAKGGPK